MASNPRKSRASTEGKNSLTFIHFAGHIIAVSSTATNEFTNENAQDCYFEISFQFILLVFNLTRGVLARWAITKHLAVQSVSIPAATLQRVRGWCFCCYITISCVFLKGSRMLPEYFVIPNEIGISRIPVTSKPMQKKRANTHENSWSMQCLERACTITRVSDNKSKESCSHLVYSLISEFSAFPSILSFQKSAAFSSTARNIIIIKEGHRLLCPKSSVVQEGRYQTSFFIS